MTNETVRLFAHDRLLARTVLPFIPAWILPNHVTIARFLLIPLVTAAAWKDAWSIALPLFVIAGLSDVLDGTLARVRRKITMWGTIADPVADKTLVICLVASFLVRDVHELLAFSIVFVELLIGLGAWLRHRRGEYLSANGSGKVKMALQVIGISLLLLARMTGSDVAFDAGVAVLVASVGFAVVSLVTYGL